jgi:DNA replication protein DnaD
MSLRVAAIALVGYDLDYLDKILRQWLEEGFQENGPVVDFARDLREKIAVPRREDVSSANGKAA